MAAACTSLELSRASAGTEVATAISATKLIATMALAFAAIRRESGRVVVAFDRVFVGFAGAKGMLTAVERRVALLVPPDAAARVSGRAVLAAVAGETDSVPPLRAARREDGCAAGCTGSGICLVATDGIPTVGMGAVVIVTIVGTEAVMGAKAEDSAAGAAARPNIAETVGAGVVAGAATGAERRVRRVATAAACRGASSPRAGVAAAGATGTAVADSTGAPATSGAAAKNEAGVASGSAAGVGSDKDSSSAEYSATTGASTTGAAATGATTTGAAMEA